MDQGWDWAKITSKYGDPHNAALPAAKRFDIAETIALKAGKTSPKVNLIGGGFMALSVATSGYQISVGVNQINQGNTGLGAIDVAEGITG